MTMTRDEVLSLFKPLESGDGAKFFAHVADDVDWTVMGTHPLAGHYRSRSEFVRGTFARLAQALGQGAKLVVTHVLVSGDWATVELEAHAIAKSGLKFDNKYCWLVRFADDKIVEVRAYLDSALVQRVLDENPI
jgi:hypothetical protein